MSVRGAEGAGASQSQAQAKERRAAAGQRVHFEALVAVGGASGGPGFEAESVDVSPDGMRLRTAYLPELGDRLVCRFDGVGSEILAEGEVIWRNEEAKGGEFGLRFRGLDAAATEALRAMCEPPSDGANEPAAVPRGTRVRLHIEGLGSPMKARVREAAQKELEVGSNLEFLRVGRSIELEDCERGGKREAVIDTVTIDVDPATNVPQLVVSLRYQKAGEAKLDAPPATKSSAAPKRSSLRPPAASTTDEAAEDAKADERAKARADERAKAKALAASKDGDKASAGAKRGDAPEAADHDADDEAGEDGELKPGVGARALTAGRAFAGRIGPALSGAGARAGVAIRGVVAAMAKRRAESEDEVGVSPPRRTTAPAPGGGLKSEGRRVVREDDGANDDETPAGMPKRTNRKAAAIGGVLGLLAVLAVVGGARMMSARSAAIATADGETASAAGSAAALAAAAPAGSGGLGVNVPLIGATTMSTTEPVLAPPAESAAALAGAPGQGDGAGPSGDADESAPTLSAGGKEFGQGSVSHPKVIKLAMDGPIDHINGAAGAMGFTISLPDRRALSTAAGELAKKDKRIASVNVINTSHGAEVTVQFKDGVPAYMARAKGDKLEIALGAEGHGAGKKVAKAHKKGDEKGSKKAAKKHHK